MASKPRAKKKSGNTQSDGAADKDRLIDELNGRIAILEKSAEVVNRAPMGVYEIDFRGPRFNRVNDYMCEVTGYTREELLAMDPFDLLDGESQARFRERVKKHFAGEKVDDQVEYWGKKKDGQTMRWVLKVSFTYGPDGQPIGAIVVGEDITERRRVEEGLDRSQALLKAITDGTPDPVYIKDLESRILLCNPALLRIYGRPLEDVIGKTDKELYDDPAIGEAIVANDRMVIGAGQSMAIEEVATTPDGLRTFISTKAPYRDGNGNIIGIIGISRDITERKQADEALRESEQRLLEAQRIAHIGNWKWSLQTGEVLWSPEVYAMHGISEDSTALTPDLLISQTHPDDKEKVNAAISRAVSEGTSADLDYRIVRPDGTMRVIHATGAVTEFDNEGKPLTMVGTNQDITERKRAEEALRESMASTERHRAELDAALSSIAAGVIMYGPSGKIVRMNDSALKMLGVSLADIDPENYDLRKTIIGTCKPDGTPLLREEAPYYRALHGESIEGYEVRFELKDREPLWVSTAASPIRDAEGEIAGAIAIFTDITGRKRAEEALGAHTARLAAVLDAQSEIANANVGYAALCQLLLERMTCLVSAEGATLEIAEGDEMVVEAATGSAGRFVGLRLKKTGSLTGQCLMSNQILRSDDSETDPRVNRESARRTGHRSMLAIPLRYDDRSFGVMKLLSSRAAAFPADTEETLRMMSEFLGVTVGRQKAEEALRESEEKYRTLTENVPGVIQRFDKYLRVIYLSPQAEKATGIFSEKFIGRTNEEMGMPPELCTLWNDLFHRVEATKEPQSIVFDFPGSGGIQTFLLKVVPEFAPDGSLESFLGISSDITELKQAERKLSEQAFLLANVNDAVIGTDAGHKINYWNESAEKTYGYRSDEIMGQYAGVLKPEFIGMTNQEALKKLEDTGELKVELTHVAKDGRKIFIDSTNRLLYDEAGKRIGNISINRDITERMRAEEALRESEEKYRELVENANSIILRSDRDGNITFFNEFAQQFFDYSEAEIIGRNAIGTIIPATDSAGNDLTAMLDDLLRRPERYRTNVHQNMRKNGELVWVSWANRAVYDERGNFAGLFCVGNDITELKQAEEALWESEARYRDIVETANEGIWIADLEARTTFVNKRMAEMLGLSVEEMTGKSVYEFMDEEAIALAKKNLERRKQGLKGSYEQKYIRKDGSRLWALANATPLRDEHSNIIGSIGIITDITERKLAEDELRESEERFSAIYENAAVGINMLSLDGQYIKSNQKFCELTGYTRDELLAMTLNDIYLAEDQARVAGDFGRLLAGEIQTHICEIRFRRKDGLIRWARISSSLLKAGGEPAYLIRVVEDTTERKLAEEEKERLLANLQNKTRDLELANEELEVKTEELAAQQEEIECANEELRTNNDELHRVTTSLNQTQDYLESLINYANAPIIVWDPKFTITRFNRAFEHMSGYNASEVIGRELVFLFPSDSWEESLGKIKKTLEGEHWESVEIPIRHKYGNRRIVLWNSANIYGNDKSLLATIAQGQDITGRKEIEKDLEEAKTQAELYLDLMGHDISNMHQIIKMQLELADSILKEDGSLKNEDIGIIDTSLRTLDKAAKLIENVRKLQVLKSGDYHMETVDMGKMLEDVVKIYSNIPGKNIKINYSPNGGYFVRATPLLKDVFGNIVDNAVKHSGDPVEIDVGVHKVGLDGSSYYRVSIEDNGMGIPDDKKEEVFHRFKRGQTKAKGTGLGLYLVKNLVESFGGYVEVQNRVIRDHTKGTRFLVYLPVLEEDHAR